MDNISKLGIYRLNPNIWVEGDNADEVMGRVTAVLVDEFGSGNVVIDEVPVLEAEVIDK